MDGILIFYHLSNIQNYCTPHQNLYSISLSTKLSGVSNVLLYQPIPPLRKPVQPSAVDSKGRSTLQIMGQIHCFPTKTDYSLQMNNRQNQKV